MDPFASLQICHQQPYCKSVTAPDPAAIHSFTAAHLPA